MSIQHWSERYSFSLQCVYMVSIPVAIVVDGAFWMPFHWVDGNLRMLRLMIPVNFPRTLRGCECGTPLGLSLMPWFRTRTRLSRYHLLTVARCGGRSLIYRRKFERFSPLPYPPEWVLKRMRGLLWYARNFLDICQLAWCACLGQIIRCVNDRLTSGHGGTEYSVDPLTSWVERWHLSVVVTEPMIDWCYGGDKPHTIQSMSALGDSPPRSE